MTKVAVLEVGPVIDELKARYGTYPDMFARLLGNADPGLDFHAISLINGEPLPAPDEHDAYLITGSRYGVYDDIEWIPALRQFVRDVDAAGRRMVGICFGHQIMAEAYGGRVEKSKKGWGLGLHGYDIKTKPWMTGALPKVRINALHQDQVVEAPPGAELIAGWDFCEFGGFQFSPRAISFQFHPEFAPDFFRDLIVARRGTIIPEDIADAGLESVEDKNDAPSVARWLAGFAREA